MAGIFREPKLKNGITRRDFECQRGNLTVRGTEYRPEGKHLPIAIVCHEFMLWRDSVKPYAAVLAELGYAAYCFDFCGGSPFGGKSDGRTQDMSVLTEVQDLEAVIDYAMVLPYVDHESILLLGCSQGGLVSALVAAKNKYPIEKLCLFYPAFSIPDDIRSGKALLTKFNVHRMPESFYCGPMKMGKIYGLDVMEMDPFEEIASYTGHVCIVHGTGDWLVKHAYSKRAAEVYQRSRPAQMQEEERVHLHLIRGGMHMFFGKHRGIAIEKLIEFARTDR